MGIVPPNANKMPDDNFGATMEHILNEQMVTYYLLDATEKENIRRGFELGFRFARIGFLSRGIK